MEKNTFAELVKKTRVEIKKLSYRKFAELLPVTHRTIRQYELGLNFPKPEVFNKMCDIFGWDKENTSLMIQRGKAPSEIRNYLSSNPFPALRAILLKFYTDKCNGRKYTSLDEIQKIIKTLPIHPIEMKVLSEAYVILKSAADKEVISASNVKTGGRLKISSIGIASLYNDPIECFERLSFQGKQLLLQKAKFNWSYDSKTKHIIFINHNNDRPLIKKFALWNEITK